MFKSYRSKVAFIPVPVLFADFRNSYLVGPSNSAGPEISTHHTDDRVATSNELEKKISVLFYNVQYLLPFLGHFVVSQNTHQV